jgi:hypothetical protein
MTVSDIPILTDDQRQSFDNNGFLLVEEALPPEMLGDVSYDLGAYIPKDEDVPVRALLKELKAAQPR